MLTIHRKDINVSYRFEATPQPLRIRVTVGNGGAHYLSVEGALRAVHNIARAGGRIVN